MNEKHWLVLELENDWKAVVPNNDTQPHANIVLNFPDGEKDATLAGFDCPCKPQVDFKNKTIIHNSFDGREANETTVSETPNT